jgi:DNA replication protein DnaC
MRDSGGSGLRWINPANLSDDGAVMDAIELDNYFEILKKAGVPKAYRLWSLRDHAVTDPRKEVGRDSDNIIAQELCDKIKPKEWLILGGPVGVGKTTFATATFNDAIARRLSKNKHFGSRIQPVWTTESRFLRMAHVSGTAGHHGRLAYVGKLAIAPLLVLDDLGGSRVDLSKWAASAVRDILDERYANERPTMFTTNLDEWDTLDRRYGGHIVSRMIGLSEGMGILGGRDRRRG